MQLAEALASLHFLNPAICTGRRRNFRRETIPAQPAAASTRQNHPLRGSQLSPLDCKRWPGNSVRRIALANASMIQNGARKCAGRSM